MQRCNLVLLLLLLIFAGCKKNQLLTANKVTITTQVNAVKIKEEKFIYNSDKRLQSKTLDDYLSSQQGVIHYDYSFFYDGQQLDSVYIKKTEAGNVVEMGRRYFYNDRGGISLALISTKNPFTNVYNTDDSIYCYTDAFNRLVLTKQYSIFLTRYLADSSIYNYDAAGNMVLTDGYQAKFTGGLISLELSYRFERQFDNYSPVLYPQPVFFDYFSEYDFPDFHNIVRNKKTYFNNPQQVFEYTETYTYNSRGRPATSVRTSAGASLAEELEFLYE